jgi:transposase-like protein
MPRTCTICRHPERLAIEADLRAGIPYRDIARRHNISKHALSRHRLNHLSRHTATALATTMKIKPLLDKAETAPTLNGTLLAIREARRCLEELVMLLNLGSVEELDACIASGRVPTDSALNQE